MGAPREWLIRKAGYYYRPNRAGYTSEKAEAGRYTKAEADLEAAIEPWRMSAVHESEVPETTPVADLVERITSLEAELAARDASLSTALKEVERLRGWSNDLLEFVDEIAATTVEQWGRLNPRLVAGTARLHAEAFRARIAINSGGGDAA